MSDALTTRAQAIAATENEKLWARTPGSKTLFDRAVTHMPMGVGSSFQAWDPYPVYLRSGSGSGVTDVDGNQFLDFHNGFGAMVVGHAHPKIAEAINRAATTGTHFAAPTAAVVEFCRDLVRAVRLRFGAVRELGNRSDDERDPGGPGRHRP